MAGHCSTRTRTRATRVLLACAAAVALAALAAMAPGGTSAEAAREATSAAVQGAAGSNGAGPGSNSAGTGLNSAGPTLGPQRLRLIDDWNRTVSLARPVARIVSLAPHATELLFASGAAAQVVAVDRNSDWPPSVRSLPRLSSFPRPDAERLIALSPDLVVVWGPGISSAVLDRLVALGLNVFVSDPHRLDDVAATMRRFARLAPSPSQGLAAADAFAQRLARIRAQYAHAAPVRVFVQIWSSPLIGIADRGVIGDAIRSCGGANVLGDAPVIAPHLDPEAVLAARPDLVIATDGPDSAVRWAERGLLAPRGPARFVEFDASLLERPGARSIDALERLCADIDAVRTSLK